MYWYESAIAKLDNFEPFQRDENLPLPNVIAKRNAAAILQELAKMHLEEPNIYAHCDGGVVIAYRRGKIYVDVDCYNDAEMLTARVIGDTEYSIDTVEPDLGCHTRVAWMMYDALTQTQLEEQPQ